MKRILILLSLFAGIALLKDYNAQELIYAVNIAYNADRTNKMLLSVARDYQNKVLVSDAGYAVAKAVADGEAEDVKFSSVFYRDGGKGVKVYQGSGALAVKYSFIGGNSVLFCVAFNDNSPLEEHSVDVEGQKVTWKGPAYMKVN